MRFEESAPRSWKAPVSRWADLWPLLLLGAVSIPLGLVVFRAGERYAKRHGKLKRSG